MKHILLKLFALLFFVSSFGQTKVTIRATTPGSSNGYPSDTSVSINNRINTKLNISDTANLRPRLYAGTNVTITGTYPNQTIAASGSGGIADDSINAFGNQIQLYAGVLKVNRSGGTNTWSMLEDADHTQLGITSVTSDASKVTVNYRPGSKVITMLGGQDETMSFAAQTNDGTPFYTFGPYFLGARVFVDYAEFYLKKIVNASFLVTYNGSSWVVTGDAYNPSSPAWTVTWSAGRLRIKDMAAGMRKNPSANMYSPNGVVTNMKYIPTIEVISSTWVDVYFYDASTGAKYTDATPPTDFGVYLDFGVFGNQVNPNTEDFGNTGVTNFWIFGIMKK